MTISTTVEDLSSRLEAELSDIVTARQMPLYDMMYYHMGWSEGAPPAARVRAHGIISLLVCQAAGGDVDAGLPVAAAVELVSNFCQIHDDVQGGIPQRDSRDAVWWVWGPAQAINAGDGMHAMARLSLFRLTQRGVSPETTFRAVQLLDEASLRTCEGRFLDIEAQERIDVSVESYLKMASSKSGSLVSCAMKLGALVASADQATIDAVGDAGDKLGIALQIRADVRELWGLEGTASEVMNKKKLLPVVYAVETASIKEKRRLGDIYFKRVLEPKDVEVLRQALEDLGARDASEKLIEQHRADASAALDASGLPAESRAPIEGLADSLLAG